MKRCLTGVAEVVNEHIQIMEHTIRINFGLELFPKNNEMYYIWDTSTSEFELNKLNNGDSWKKITSDSETVLRLPRGM